MRVEWHPLARTDLVELVSYIAVDNVKAAYQMLEEVERQTAILTAHPRAGRLGRVAGTRELIVTGTPYIAAYRFTGSQVTILRLLHGAMRWPQDL